MEKEKEKTPYEVVQEVQQAIKPFGYEVAGFNEISDPPILRGINITLVKDRAYPLRLGG